MSPFGFNHERLNQYPLGVTFDVTLQAIYGRKSSVFCAKNTGSPKTLQQQTLSKQSIQDPKESPFITCPST